MALRKGTRGIDTLVGTATHDLIVAYNGNDVLRGLAGNDKIYAGGGNDSIDAGAGDDTITSQGGSDTIIGGDGNDFITATEYGVFGTVTDPTAIDRIFAGAGFDYVVMDHNDVAYGGTGVDVFSVDANTETAARWAVNLSNIGSAGLGRIAAAGTYFGALQVAQFEGASIYLRNALGGSVLTGSNGRDSLGLEKAFAAPDAAIFKVDGRGGDDYITGSAGRDNLIGGAGDDKLYGGFGGADTLVGGTGDDELNGNGGQDRLTGNAGVDQFVFSLSEFAAGDLPRVMDFSHVDDILVFTRGNLDVDFGTEVNVLRVGGTVTNGNTASGVAQFLYSTTTGTLAVDVNGSAAGGVTTLLFLQGAPMLTASDILIV
jgi:Ca2+-binding RTX toxin-like protein